VRKSTYPVWELLVKRYLFIGLFVGTLLTALDSFFHGSFVFTPFEFFKVNVLNDIGSFYGVHPFYWYFSTGLPTILGIGVIPFFLSVFVAIQSWNESKSRQYILYSIIFTIFAYSLLAHKEFRFLLQILPLCLYCITQFLSDWSRTKSSMTIWFVVVTIFIANAVPAGYLGYVHQQGTINAMDKLSTVATDYKTSNGSPAKFLFLMPCHSTPYYSHIHANITMRFLTCEPNLKNQENYVDEADKFYEAPMKWIRSHLPVHPVSALPTHVIVFDSLAAQISDFLSIYKPLEIFFHADYLTSTRNGQNVIIYERIEQVAKKKVVEEPPADNIDDQKPAAVQDEL
jgi:phosphatidylinositol glycan class B